MPLIKSSSDKAVGKNISEMEKSGYKNSQAIAAALANQRSAKMKHMSKGGMVHDASKGAPEMDTGAIMEKLRQHLTPAEHAHLAKYTQDKTEAPRQQAGGWATFPESEGGESLSPNVREAGDDAPEAPMETSSEEADMSPPGDTTPQAEASTAEEDLSQPDEATPPTQSPSPEREDEDFSYAAQMKRKANEYLSDGDEDNGVSLRHAELSVRKPDGGGPTMMSAGGITKPGTKEDAKAALARRKAKFAMERASYKPRG